MAIKSALGLQREEEYKAIRQAKSGRVSHPSEFPVCAKCVEGHLRCPGPDVDVKGEWVFDQKCLRCVHKNWDCDFLGEKSKV